MRKSIKILTLVLALALICGAFVVSAFAANDVTEVTGIKTYANVDMSSPEADEFTTSMTYPKLNTSQANVFLCHNNRADTYKFVTNPYDPTNKYFDWEVNTSGSGNPYIAINLGGDPTLSSGVPNYKDHVGVNTKYVVIDVDLAFPTGKAITNIAFALHERPLDSDGKASAYINSDKFVDGYAGLSLINFQNGGKFNGYVYAGSWSNQLEYGTSWNHYTVVAEYKLCEDEAGQYVEKYVHIYFNGERVISEYTWTNKNDAANYYGGDRTAIGLNAIRLGYNSTTKEGRLLMDNLAVRTVTADYTGNLGSVISSGESITAWDANVWDGEVPFGTPVAQNTSTGVYYDRISKAFAEVEEGEELVLMADMTEEALVTVPCSVDTAGYTPMIKTAEGIVLVDEDGYYTYEEAQEYLTVNWAAYEDVAGVDIGGVQTKVTLGSNILAAYEDFGGKSHDYAVEVGGLIYALTGWTDADGNVVSADAVVTEDMLGTDVTYTPVVVTKTPTYEVTTNGVVTTYADDYTLKTVIESLTSASTVKLLTDVYSYENVYVKKNLTLDLNGHMLTTFCAAVQNADAQATHPGYPIKFNMLTPNSGVELTVKGDVEGSMLLHGAVNVANGAKFGAALLGAQGSSISNFEGEHLIVSAAMIVGSWGAGNIKLNFNGGYYTKGNMSDSSGWVFFNASAHGCAITASNATFDATFNAPMFHALAADNTLTIDNCVLKGDMIRIDSLFATTITNSYIMNSVDLSKNDGTAINGTVTGPNVVLGAGNFIANGASVTSTCAEGVKMYDTLENREFTTYSQRLTATNNVIDASSYVVTSGTVSADFIKATLPESDPITVTWHNTDGSVIGTTEAIPGLNASSPTVTVADGWVNAQYTDWTNASGEATTVVPVGATEASFTLVEGSDAIYTANKVPVYMNYDVVLHFQLNHYVPVEAPEGVADVKVIYQNGNNVGASASNWVIDGVKYKNYTSWPGAAAADDDATFGVSFTYNGQAIVYNYTVKLDAYAQAIFDGDYNVAGSDGVTTMQNVVADMLRYIDAANTVAGKTTKDAVKALITDGGAGYQYLTTVPAVEENTTAVDFSAVSDYITGITAGQANGGGFGFILTTTMKHDWGKGFLDASGNAIGYGIDYTIDGVAQNPDVRGANNTSAWMHNMRAYNLNDEYVISVVEFGEDGKYNTEDDVVVGSITYTFAQYYTAVYANATDAEKAYIDAVWAYSNALSALSGR